MTLKVRKQFYLDAEQAARLKRLATSNGIAEAELIRRALVAYLSWSLQHELDPSAWEKEKQFIEGWIAQGPVSGGRTWTRDELYDRFD